MAAVLVWGPVDVSLAWLLPTPGPSSTPQPTLMPGQIVAEFVPQLQETLSQADWPRAFEIVEIMDSVDPDGDEVRHWAAIAHLTYGLPLGLGPADLDALGQFEQVWLWRRATPKQAAGSRLPTRSWPDRRRSPPGLDGRNQALTPVRCYP